MTWLDWDIVVVSYCVAEEDSYQDTPLFGHVTAIATVVTVAEILKNNGLAIEKSKLFCISHLLFVGIFIWKECCGMAHS